jgi:hypothetical protein
MRECTDPTIIKYVTSILLGFALVALFKMSYRDRGCLVKN